MSPPLSLSPQSSYLDVKLEGSDGLLQHSLPLLLCHFYAVHPAAVELFEQGGVRHAREGEEGQAVAVLQAQGLLGDTAQDLSSRQVTEVPRVGMGDQEFRVFFANLCRGVDQ